MSTNQNEHMERPGREGTGVEHSALLRGLRDQTFRTPDGRPFIPIDSDRGPKIVPIHSRKFRQWFGFKLEEETGERPSQAELRSAIDRLEVYALDAPVADVYLRAAQAAGRLYIDLADDRGRVIEVGSDGWSVIDNAPVHFIRPPSMRPLPAPEKGGSIEDLRSLINVADDGDFVLIVAFLLDALRNDGAHPVLVINGGEGAAKSTLVEILRELIDPSRTPLSGLPHTERKLLEAGDSYLRVYDNVSSIPAKVSEALCRMSTGRSAHPVIVNGISDLSMRPDLADRCLFVTLAPVSDRQRRSQQEIWTTFEQMRPRILGVRLRALASSLGNCIARKSHRPRPFGARSPRVNEEQYPHFHVPTVQHPGSSTSQIPNVPPGQHSTWPTSRLVNLPHFQHPGDHMSLFQHTSISRQEHRSQRALGIAFRESWKRKTITHRDRDLLECRALGTYAR
jgi:hypothetical protein